MNHMERYALDATKEIVIARMSNANLSANKAGGEAVADFFAAIYSGIKKIVDETEK